MVEWAERFWSKVDFEGPGGCWLWTGFRNRDGYSRFSINNRQQQAHRLSYEQMVGPIPEGLQIDHLCRVRHCVNPDHLEPVTGAENVFRGDHWQRRKTHCPQGHPYSGANLAIGVRGDGRTFRMCRECRRLRAQAR